MRADEALVRLGGVADGRTLRRLVSQGRIRSEVRRGDIVRVAHRCYALPNADAGARAAARLAGVASHLSAAALHGWAVKNPPDQPTVVVPRNRRVDPSRRRGVRVLWRNVSEAELAAGVTTKVRTVIDCARDLPFDEALAVADSALRSGEVTQDELVEAALALSTTGRRAALRVAGAADGRAANPFESVLRAIALEAGLIFEPQRVIDEAGFRCRPDLVDAERRIVVEADSYEFHASREALARDCRRYTALVVRGWRVVRFTWREVMFEPDYVRSTLVALVHDPPRQAPRAGSGGATA